MKLPRPPAAVLFDMDGLIFDTEALYRTALISVAGEARYEMTDALFQQMIGSPWPTNRAFLLGHFGADYPADVIREASHQRLREMTAATPFLKSGVIELLDALADWGLPHAIATSSSHDTVQEHLADHDLAHRFPVVIAHGDYNHGKPAPDPFLTAAARLGVAPQDCVALEDSHNGVRSAAAAGTMTIMVPDLLDATQEMCGLCTRVAADLHDVREIIRATLSDT
ncbi:MAG TPA: HAD family phosphatase [Sphingobium sp.]